ncbi:MAG: hypothetical protein V3V40_06415 [Nitrosomonadaceae bacterium]
MGEIADQIVNGECCEFCQKPHVLPFGLGYAYTCDECRDESPADILSAIKKPKSNCPMCNKLVKRIGFHHHIKDCHPELLDKAFEALRKVLEDSK